MPRASRAAQIAGGMVRIHATGSSEGVFMRIRRSRNQAQINDEMMLAFKSMS
jgi:hypothetical protein